MRLSPWHWCQPQESIPLTDSVAVEPVRAREQRANLSVLAATGFLRGAHSSAYGALWQPFVLSLGASMPLLGLLNSLSGMNGIIPTLVQPLGGWLADRLGRRPLMIVSSLAILAAYALFAAAGLSSLWVWAALALGSIALGISALANPARSSMTAESVHAGRQGSAFSLMLVASTLPGIIAPALGGWVADHLGYVTFFPMAIALEALGLLLVWRYVQETRTNGRGSVRLGDWLRVLLRSVVPPRGLTGFFLAMAGDSFVWGIGFGLLYGMAAETLHFSAGQLGMMSSVMSLTCAALLMPVGRYIDHHGTRGPLILSEALGIPLMLIWITQTRFEAFLVAHALFAVNVATWVPVVSTHLTRAVPEAERSEAFGRMNMFRGLVSFPSSAIGGLLYAWGGMRAPIIANLIGIFGVLAILVFWVKEPMRRET
jgi:MFS transporter, DHA1 family, multidrug resistance protein B